MSDDLKARIAELEQENDTLRGLLGNSAKPCPYCGLAAEDQAKCERGFPGCASADDQVLSKHFADAWSLKLAGKRIAELEAELASAYKSVDENWVSHQQVVAMRAERDAAIARAEAAEQDARRYRLLRDPPGNLHEELAVCSVDEALFGDRLDAVVDSFLAQEKGAT